jgi:hypothetical protein
MWATVADVSSPAQKRPEMDTSPIYLWAALILGLVIAALVVARFMGRL